MSLAGGVAFMTSMLALTDIQTLLYIVAGLIVTGTVVGVLKSRAR